MSNHSNHNNQKSSVAALAEQQKAAEKPAVAQVVTPEEAKEERGRKISAAQMGVPKRPVTVKVDGKEYGTLCDALRAHGFNVQGDWIKARKLLKLNGKADMVIGDKTITFINA